MVMYLLKRRAPLPGLFFVCQESDIHTVDGSEIRRSPVQVGSGSPIIYDWFYKSQVVSRISSANSI